MYLFTPSALIGGIVFMNEPDKVVREEAYNRPAIEIAIRIGVIVLLKTLCFINSKQ